MSMHAHVNRLDDDRAVVDIDLDNRNRIRLSLVRHVGQRQFEVRVNLQMQTRESERHSWDGPASHYTQIGWGTLNTRTGEITR